MKLVALIGVVLWSFMLRPYCAYPGLVKGFIANQGQYDERIQFYTSIGNSEIFILSDGMVLKSSKSLNHNNQVETDYFGYMNADQDSVQFRKKIVCVKVEFEDSKEEPIILVNGRMSAKVNYIKGDLFSDWFINVPVYKIVEYEDVWPGINMLFEYRESGINVKLKYTHNSDITNVRFNILDHGILDQHCESSIILRIEDLDDILSYFGQQGFDLNIDFNINDFIGISNKRINTEKMLLPGNIVWSTYFGSNEWEYLHDICRDTDDNLLLTGYTYSPNLPVTLGAYDEIYSGQEDAFLAKLNHDGSDLIWCTYIGGNGLDIAYALGVDSLGDVVLAGGTTSEDFPITPGVFDDVYDVSANAFVSKISTEGDDMIWSTYINHAIPWDIHFDSNSNPVIAGMAQSDLFPTTLNAFDTDYNGGVTDGFLTKLNSNGSDIIWSTFIGSYDYDSVKSIILNSIDEVFITGYTYSAEFPTTGDAWDLGYNGNADGFIAKFNDSAQNLIYSTYYGGNGKDLFNGICLDSNDAIVLIGSTNTFGFPTTPGAYDYWGYPGYNAFVVKFSSDYTLIWSTLYSGSNDDFGVCMSIDMNNNILLAGNTLSTDIPTMNAISNVNSGAKDAFLALLDNRGEHLLWGSYIGGNHNDGLRSMILDSYGYPIIGGFTVSDNYPTTINSYQEDYNYEDLFITKIGGIPTSAFLGRFVVGRIEEWAEIQWNIAYTIVNAQFWLWRNEESSELEQIVGPLIGNSLHWKYIDENAPIGECEYWLQVKANDDLEEWYGPEALEAVDVVKPAFLLNQNYPNPFNPETTLMYSLVSAGQVKLTIYDIHGRQIVTLIDGPMPAGNGSVSWDGRNSNGLQVASGSYIAKLETAAGIQTRKLVLSR